MRILIATPLYPPDAGGPATYTSILENELPKRRVPVRVVSFGAVRHLPTGIRHLVYFFRLLRTSRGATHILALDPFSVGVPAALVAKLTRKKFIVRIAGDFAWEQGTQRFGITDPLDEFSLQTERYGTIVQLLKRVQLWVAEKADEIIVPSQYLRRIVSNWGIAKRHISVVYSCIRDPGNMGNRETIRGLLQFNGKLIVSVGRLVPWKGFRELIEAVGELRRSVPDIKLFIVGGGPQEKELETLIEERSLDKHVSLAGPLERSILLRYVSVADVFVLNTGYEGFSHQLLEAMAIGIPVVTTNVGGNPELITHNKNGILVEHNDRKALVHALKRVLTTPATAKKFSTAGKETATLFNEERMTDETLAVLKHA